MRIYLNLEDRFVQQMCDSDGFKPSPRTVRKARESLSPDGISLPARDVRKLILRGFCRASVFLGGNVTSASRARLQPHLFKSMDLTSVTLYTCAMEAFGAALSDKITNCGPGGGSHEFTDSRRLVDALVSKLEAFFVDTFREFSFSRDCCVLDDDHSNNGSEVGRKELPVKVNRNKQGHAVGCVVDGLVSSVTGLMYSGRVHRRSDTPDVVVRGVLEPLMGVASGLTVGLDRGYSDSTALGAVLQLGCNIIGTAKAWNARHHRGAFVQDGLDWSKTHPKRGEPIHGQEGAQGRHAPAA